MIESRIKPFEIGGIGNEHAQNYAYEMSVEQQRKYWKDTLDLQKAAELERIHTQAEIARAAEKEKIRLVGAQMRSLQKEEEEERKRAICEELQIAESGELHIVTKNLQIGAKPRIVTNMTHPVLFVLKRAKCKSEKIFEIRCRVSGEETAIFLNPEKIVSGTYLINKFASIGVVFLNSTVSEKKLAIQLEIGRAHV